MYEDIPVKLKVKIKICNLIATYIWLRISSEKTKYMTTVMRDVKFYYYYGYAMHLFSTQLMS